MGLGFDGFDGLGFDGFRVRLIGFVWVEWFQG